VRVPARTEDCKVSSRCTRPLPSTCTPVETKSSDQYPPVSPSLKICREVYPDYIIFYSPVLYLVNVTKGTLERYLCDSLETTTTLELLVLCTISESKSDK
jgi:hypothetical protein